ncbi:3-beta-hydroxysteroid-Delta(8),Delta(7)-isomerase [Magnaporthiopsis poae ATCC 64411]|uniref:3-beta-hydroxysteroid-Delta(8), Delta(7)-isomerase n=1 Tax=Magnaporthiopsis poae (strain ATCC 64411 / 73-15) TaxID=644358 RepID=A0A0C4DSA3_MAGP6|nr:3-beta-hydroxysteroid-Delta(8),Delta(7)-isomerase [Magnaporthiopsis poae ATCC 64411]
MTHNASSVLPAHPYSPPGVPIPGYVANTLSTPTIFAIFVSTLSAVLLPAAYRIRRVRPDLPAGEMATAMWFVGCAVIHFFLEGYYAYNFRDIASQSTIPAQLWKEYSLSDSRYLIQDPFMVPMEGVTAVLWGPLSALVACLIVWAHPLRHPLQLVVSVGQLYGDVLYYGNFMMHDKVWGRDHCRPEPYYFWCYYVFMNAIWIVVPGFLAFRSVRASARAFAAVDGAKAKVKAKGR